MFNGSPAITLALETRPEAPVPSNLHCGRSIDRLLPHQNIPGTLVAVPPSWYIHTSHSRTRGRWGRINSSFPRDTGESAERRTAASSPPPAPSAATGRPARTNNEVDRRISWADFAPGRSSRRWISPRCWAPPRDSLSARRSLCRWHSRPQDPVSNGWRDEPGRRRRRSRAGCSSGRRYRRTGCSLGARRRTPARPRPRASPTPSAHPPSVITQS